MPVLQVASSEIFSWFGVTSVVSGKKRASLAGQGDMLASGPAFLERLRIASARWVCYHRRSGQMTCEGKIALAVSSSRNEERRIPLISKISIKQGTLVNLSRYWHVL